MRKTLRFLTISLCLQCATSQAQLRVVTWNTAGAARSGTSEVLEAIGNESVSGIVQPIDILSLQEQSSSATTTQDIVDLLNGLYGAGTYARATLDGDTAGAGRPGLIYNTTTVSLESQLAFGVVDTSNQARQTLRYQLRPLGYANTSDIYVYSNHYKASTGTSNKNRRLIEATALRADADALGEGTNIIYTGDFNIRSSSEDMYDVALLSPGNGQAFDPLDAEGSWHDSPAFKSLHTQAPASNPPGGLIGSGVDDRFDFQLVTGELLDHEGLSYIEGSYHTFGNNGTHALNGSISSGTGASASILSMLEMASDHLPVVADYQVPSVLDIVSNRAGLPLQVELGALVELEIIISNAADVIVAIGADELNYDAIAKGAALGAYSDSDDALGGGNMHTFTLDTSTLGMQSGEISISSNSPLDKGLASLFFDFEVLATADGDFDEDGDIDGSDFLAWQRGMTSAADLAIWEQAYGVQPLSTVPVPEPGAFGLLLLSIVGLLSGRTTEKQQRKKQQRTTTNNKGEETTKDRQLSDPLPPRIQRIARMKKKTGFYS